MGTPKEPNHFLGKAVLTSAFSRIMNIYRTAVTIRLARILGKCLTTGIIFFGLILFSPNQANSYPAFKTAPAILEDNSISTQNLTTTSITSEEVPEEVLGLQSYLESKRSPLAKNSVDFYLAAAEFDIDPYLLPAISGIESSFGQALIPGSYNPFGWNGGKSHFSNFREAIYTVASTLRKKYVPSGAISAEKIGRTYASSWPTWIPKVQNLKKAIESSVN